MAAAAVVHPRTMSRALRRLRELGYIVYRPGYGYYVSETPPGQPRRALPVPDAF